MTPSKKLAAVIEAQLRGGWNAHSRFIDDRNNYPMPDAGKDTLFILLDPEGLKAAYPASQLAGAKDYEAHQILDAWLSGGAEAAISTAFDLLPAKG